MCYRQMCLNGEKVIHHDHLTGEIYGVAHNSCNLKLRTQTFTPIFFHNLSKYDAHHLLKYIEIQSEEKLTVIPCNSETHISFSFFVPVCKSKDDKLLYEEFRFLDSYRFYLGVLTLWLQHSKQRTVVKYLNFSKNIATFCKRKEFSHIRFSIVLRNSLKNRCLNMMISG